MSLTRRNFIRTGVMSAISAHLVLSTARIAFAQTAGAGQDVPIEAQKEPVFFFRLDTFKPYVGGYFESPNARGEMIAMQLVSAEAFKPSLTALRVTKKAGETDSFSLLFKAAAQLPPYTSIHKIKHPSLGEFYLFLSPKKGDSGELLYEAIINHVK
jgi:uncharacterized protein DUF6916